MNITVNGKPYELAKPVTVQELAEMLALALTQIAIELNREIVPRSRYGNTMLNAGDTVEIVTFIGGG